MYLMSKLKVLATVIVSVLVTDVVVVLYCMTHYLFNVTKIVVVLETEVVLSTVLYFHW